jgi:hypothetical protein
MRDRAREPINFMYQSDINIIAIEGKTVTNVRSETGEVHITCSDGSVFKLYHSQACCESVSIQSGAEDLPKLIGKTITKVVETIDNNPDGVDTSGGSATRTTFDFILLNAMPIKLVWLGESNGYYSESVSVDQIE